MAYKRADDIEHILKELEKLSAQTPFGIIQIRALRYLLDNEYGQELTILHESMQTSDMAQRFLQATLRSTRRILSCMTQWQKTG